MKHGRPGLTHRKFVAVDSRLEPSTSPNCAVLKRPKILCRQQKTLLSASSWSLLVDDANLSKLKLTEPSQGPIDGFQTYKFD
jgi:hypothetical protein